MASRDPERRGSVRQDYLVHQRVDPSASDLRTSNDRIVSSKRDVRVFHKGNFPSSRSFLIYLDRSKLDPFTNVLPRTTLDPPSPVTRVIRLALQVSGRRRRPLKGSPPSATQTERAVFPHSAFMNGFARSGEKGSVRQGYLVHQRVDLLLLDLRTSNDRIV